MKKLKKWILIADATRARIIRELVPDPETGERLEDIVMETEHKPARQIMSDRPGRSFSSHSDQRSAMEYRSDPVRVQQARFAAEIVETLDKQRKSDAFDQLIIVAEPRMLGIIRENLPDALKPFVKGEYDKDLSNLPVKKLHEALANLGAI
jgi:protein required for attachment to host cells